MQVHDKGVAVKEGVFRAQCLNKAQEQWFLIDDLHIQEILPQVVSISEAYIQVLNPSPYNPGPGPEPVAVSRSSCCLTTVPIA
jgi:hypothetical protein